MKIAITGFSSGIGQALFDYFQKEGHTCIGFSRSNGYNITSAESRNKIIENSTDCDIFVNNAYSNCDDNQLYMLQSIYETWLGQDKIIINISSRITDWPIDIKESSIEYYQTKLKQDKFCLGKRSFPQILNLRVGMTDTPRVKRFSRNKMSTNDIVDVVKFALNSKLRITSITFGL
jgi:hypothetical protein